MFDFLGMILGFVIFGLMFAVAAIGFLKAERAVNTATPKAPARGGMTAAPARVPFVIVR
jgi:hypothetical protein